MSDVRAEILSLKHQGPTSSKSFSILFPVIPSLVAVLELAASFHGCDLKHSGWLQLEGTLNPAKPSSRHGFATHGTHDSRPASGSFSDDYILRKTLISSIGNRNQRALLFECSQFETAAVVRLSRPANRLNQCERQVTGRLTRCVEAPYRCACYTEAHQP